MQKMSEHLVEFFWKLHVKYSFFFSAESPKPKWNENQFESTNTATNNDRETLANGLLATTLILHCKIFQRFVSPRNKYALFPDSCYVITTEQSFVFF